MTELFDFETCRLEESVAICFLGKPKAGQDSNTTNATSEDRDWESCRRTFDETVRQQFNECVYVTRDSDRILESPTTCETARHAADRTRRKRNGHISLE
jgi:hypothetical protein